MQLDDRQPNTQQSAEADSRHLVSFQAGDEEFAVEIRRVQEIIRYQRLTRVPNAPEFVEGVINLRGKVIPVISLRKRLGLNESGEKREQLRIVVLEIREMVVGFIVDSVPQVTRVSADSIVEPPRMFESRREYVSGVARLNDRLLILLDVDRVLGSDAGTGAAAAAGSKQN